MEPINHSVETSMRCLQHNEPFAALFSYKNLQLMADMVILGEDLLTIPTERIIDIPIEMTLIDGKVVYTK